MPSPLVPSPVNGRGENPVAFYNPLIIIDIWVFPSIACKRGDYGVSSKSERINNRLFEINFNLLSYLYQRIKNQDTLFTIFK
jgi:hypothetical protein